MIALLFTVLNLLAVIGSGIMAGLFFIFSNTIMASLTRLPSGAGASAMNSINVVIVNPLFLAIFMGTALVCAILAVKAVIGWSEPGALWLLAGSLFYLVGAIGVTMVFNVPLNDQLAAVDPSKAAGAAMWTRYLNEWLPWNHVRTIASIASLACFWVGGR
jgi:uncharacterized membrane protein